MADLLKFYFPKIVIGHVEYDFIFFESEQNSQKSLLLLKSLKFFERWSDEEISFLLTSIADYYPNIGKFRSGFDGMGDIWAKISSDFQERFDVRRTSEQCKSK